MAHLLSDSSSINGGLSLVEILSGGREVRARTRRIVLAFSYSSSRPRMADRAFRIVFEYEKTMYEDDERTNWAGHDFFPHTAGW